MKILDSDQIRELDGYTIKNEPIASIKLMERASRNFVKWYVLKFDAKRRIKIFCGTGNNGGDGLVVARLLSKKKYKVEVFVVRYSDSSSKDFKINEKRLKKETKVSLKNITEKSPPPGISSNDIVIDAMWGSGLSRKISGFSAKLITYINKSKAIIVAIDIPSGLFAAKHSDSIKIKAHYTVSFEVPKLAFMFPKNYIYVGEWEVLSIGLHQGFLNKISTKNYFISQNLIQNLIHPRKKFNHKGNFGHGLIIAGSFGKMGAAILAARACLRAGSGLLSMHVPKIGYEIMQTSVPEAMVSIDRGQKIISDLKRVYEPKLHNAVALGPGLGTDKKTREAVLGFIKRSTRPIIIDADGLNILSKHKSYFKHLPANSILTPHPKEFERLVGRSKNDFDRQKKQIAFSKKYKIHVIVKGAHSSITDPEGTSYFNATGNPGMATGGSGDVLTGILCSLIAQSYSPLQACILGVYLHGLAGDIAAKKMTTYSLIASDIVDNFGEAYKTMSKSLPGV
ncbi:MAG: NAD(P)H-hydrate dehydratase [Bacteroidetes bacterium]|nr:NAD(P)H-hydrate dehydratase [Bacteroidota bacterium]